MMNEPNSSYRSSCVIRDDGHGQSLSPAENGGSFIKFWHLCIKLQRNVAFLVPYKSQEDHWIQPMPLTFGINNFRWLTIFTNSVHFAHSKRQKSRKDVLLWSNMSIENGHRPYTIINLCQSLSENLSCFGHSVIFRKIERSKKNEFYGNVQNLIEEIRLLNYKYIWRTLVQAIVICLRGGKKIPKLIFSHSE